MQQGLGSFQWASSSAYNGDIDCFASGKCIISIRVVSLWIPLMTSTTIVLTLPTRTTSAILVKVWIFVGIIPKNRSSPSGCPIQILNRTLEQPPRSIDICNKIRDYYHSTTIISKPTRCLIIQR